MAKKCSPPRSSSVKSYLRAKRRKKAPVPSTYYVAENEHGKTCGHKHRTLTGAHSCARSTQRHYRQKYGTRSSLAGTYIVKKRTAR